VLAKTYFLLFFGLLILPLGCAKYLRVSASYFSGVEDRTFENGMALTVGAPMTPPIDVNVAISGEDENILYSCLFDRVVDGQVEQGSLCQTLPGTASFDSSTGILTWTPSIDGIYELKIVGQRGDGLLADAIFRLYVKDRSVTKNLIADYDARYATRSGPPTSSLGYWRDLAPNLFHGELRGSPYWRGNGTPVNPYALGFVGEGHVNFGSYLSGQSKLMMTGWISPAAASSSEAAILSNHSDDDGGFTLRPSLKNSDSLDFIIGRTAYEEVVTGETAPQLMGYWRLGEAAGSGTNANDSSGRGYTGTYGGAVTLGTDGAFAHDKNTSVSFNGTANSKVNFYITALDTTNNAKVTTSFWMYWNGSYGPSGAEMPIGFTNYDLMLNNGHFGFNTANSDVYGIANANLKNKWTHVVAVFTSGDAKTNKLYINGQPQSLVQKMGTTISRVLTPNFLLSGWVTNDSYRFTGQIDELALYNGELSPTQVLDQYRAGMSSCRTRPLFANNQWNFVGAIYDGMAGKLFVNGREHCNFSTGQPLASDHEFHAGKLWQGSLANLKIYGEGTPADIKTNFDATAEHFRVTPSGDVVTDGLVLHFDAANAKEGLRMPAAGCADLSWVELASSLDGTLTNFTNCGPTSGWYGSSLPTNPFRLVFDGANDVVVTPSGAPSPTNLSRGTASAWFRTISPGSGYRGIIIKAGAYGIYLKDGRATLYDWGGQAERAGTANDTSFNLADNRWHHVAVTFEHAASNGMILYVDGKKKLVTRMSVANQNNPLVIGAGTPGVQFFKGDIAQAMVYNRVLSQEEILRNCQALRTRFADAQCSD